MSRPRNAEPIGVSSADGKTEIFGVYHDDQLVEVVLAEDFAKEVGSLRAMLIKLRDQGSFHNSAIELDPRHDGEQLLAEIEALVGARE